MKERKKTTEQLQKRAADVTNALVLEMKTLKVCVQTSAQHSCTCTCSYQRFSSRASFKITTPRHLPSKTGGRASLSYSPASSLHPQIIYAIAFSAGLGLNGLQVTKLIEKTINELLLTLLAACTILHGFSCAGVVCYTCHAYTSIAWKPRSVRIWTKWLRNSFRTITQYSFLFRSSTHESDATG